MNQAKQRRGAITVEFALICTAFFAIVLGTIEFSRISIIRHAVDNAAYEGARTGIVPGATASEVVAATQAHLNNVQLTSANITVTPSVITDSTPSVTVDIEIPVGANSWVVPNFGNGLQLTATSTMRTEIARSASQ